MTFFDFSAALLAATIAYTFGDMLRCAGEKRQSAALVRAGSILVAAAVATLVALALMLYMARL